ncbi:MAG: stage II sporulation protein M, partial [Thermofilaceae archaeon]
ERRSWLFVLLALAPHGVLEIPTVLCVYTLSIGFGADLWRSLLGKDREAWKKSGIKLVKGLIASVALLALSAFIEAFITPALITMCKC